MKKFLASILFSCAFLLMVFSPSMAKQGEQKNTSLGDFTLNAPVNDEFQVDGVTTSFTVTWKQWVMVGEPVISNHMAWSMNTSGGDVIIKDMNDKKVRVRIADVPAKVLQEVFIVDLDIDAHIQSPAFKRNDNVYVRLSAGILGKPAVTKALGGVIAPGTKDFNLPDCPDWDKTFYTLIGKEQKFLAAEQAKEIVKRGFEIYASGSQVSRMDIYLEPIASWYHDQQSAKQLKQLKARQQKDLAKLKQEQQRQRQQLAKQTPPKADDDFLADLDSELSQVDLDNEQQEALQQLQQQHKQELENFSKTSQKYERYLLSLQRSGEKKLSQKKNAVEGRTLPAEELISFCANKKCGFKDSNGKIVISPQYSKVQWGFIGPYAAVCKGEKKCGIIDRKNRVVIPMEYEFFPRKKSDYFIAHASWRKVGVLDKNAHTIIPFSYRDILPVGKKRFAVQGKYHDGSMRGDEYWGLYDDHRKELLPVIYRYAIKDMGNNRIIVDASFTDIPRSGECGLLDYQGNIIIPYKYKEMAYISNDRIGVRTEEGWGVIDFSGSEIIPPVYEKIGKARVDKIVIRNNQIQMYDYFKRLLKAFDYGGNPL